MKKLTLILIGLLNFTFTFGQIYSSLISDKEIYDFLNWMTANDKKYKEEPQKKRKQIYYKILSWDTANFIKDTAQINKYWYYDENYLFINRSGTDTLFKQQDREFLFKQFTAIKKNIWYFKFSKSKLLISKKQKKTNRYYYSIPLFSVDKNYVIIERIYYCGDQCAHGGYFIYRRLDKKKWEYVTVVHPWIS